MINQQILLSDETIELVRNVCLDLGLSNIRLFVTNEYEDKDKIHFLGKSEEGSEGLSLFSIMQAEENLAKILGCEVGIVSENMLHEFIKDEVLNNVVAYKENNKKAVQEFFEQQILPRAEGTFFIEEGEGEEAVAQDELEQQPKHRSCQKLTPIF